MISEDAALAHAFELHPELQDWKDSDYEQAETQRGVNWRLHLQLDAVVLRRASDDARPDARGDSRTGEGRAKQNRCYT